MNYETTPVRTLRPAILPDNKNLVVLPVLVALGVTVTGVVVGNPVVIALPLIIVAVFPGLPILFHLVYYLSVQFQIFPDRLVVIDCASDPFVRSRGRQEIQFGSVEYVFYVDKEAHLLMNLLKKVEPYNVPVTEDDYRRENLVTKHRVPESVLDQFGQSSQKTLNDVTATGVLLGVEELCERNNIPAKVTRTILKDLERGHALDFDYVKEKLGPYAVNPIDLDRLRDEFSSLDVPSLAPFLLTRINLKKLRNIESSRHWQAGVKSRAGLVLSNNDGTRKVYLMRFRDLNRKDAQELVSAIRARSGDVKYLMTRKEAQALLR
ncbi:MAG: hypothetical protein ACE5JQ_06405 [Candidatus Methylomirabilales bacterium]